MKMVSLMFLALVSFTAHAEMYKWVDDEGVTHYTQTPPPDSNSQQLSTGSSSANSGAASAGADGPNCSKAVANAQDSIDTMLEVGEKNYKGGYIKESEYTKVSTELKKIRQQISMSECQSSQGDVRGFYTCMSNDYNHVAMCGKKYKYGE